jgi:hypothetical protein
VEKGIKLKGVDDEDVSSKKCSGVDDEDVSSALWCERRDSRKKIPGERAEKYIIILQLKFQLVLLPHLMEPQSQQVLI